MVQDRHALTFDFTRWQINSWCGEHYKCCYKGEHYVITIGGFHPTRAAKLGPCNGACKADAKSRIAHTVELPEMAQEVMNIRIAVPAGEVVIHRYITARPFFDTVDTVYEAGDLVPPALLESPYTRILEAGETDECERYKKKWKIKNVGGRAVDVPYGLD